MLILLKLKFARDIGYLKSEAEMNEIREEHQQVLAEQQSIEDSNEVGLLFIMEFDWNNHNTDRKGNELQVELRASMHILVPIAAETGSWSNPTQTFQILLTPVRRQLTKVVN